MAELSLQTQTESGVRFGLLRAERARSSPVLLNFSSTLEDSLANPDFSKASQILASRGIVGVSLDLPCHGRERRSGEPENGLAGWRVRLERGENIIDDLVLRASTVLDVLIGKDVADPKRIAVCGTSRGGFSALHFAAADERVGSVAAFAPVTDLLALSEFRGPFSPACVDVYREQRPACQHGRGHRVGQEHLAGRGDPGRTCPRGAARDGRCWTSRA